ncbi:MAG: MFS transporter [Spirochaetales bacterium]|nr:MFS transporter [Spirochaetales bacterium]
MSKHFTRINIKIGLVQGFYMMALCVCLSFIVRLLKSYGYSDYECGIALSCGAFASLTVQPLMGWMADHVRSAGRLIVCIFITSCIGAASLVFVHQSRLATYISVYVLFGAVRSLTYIIDVWSVEVGSPDPSFSYGFTRSFGSVSYSIASLVYGFAIDIFGAGFLIPCFLTLSVVAIGMVILVSSTSGSSQDNGPTQKKSYFGFKHSLVALFSNKHYVMLLLCFTLMEIGRMPGQNYLTRKFEVMGAGEVYTGIAFLVMSMLQLLPLNKMDSLKRRFRPTTLMWVALAGIFLRIVLFGISSSAIGTLCALLVEPIGLGLYIGAIIFYTLHYLPAEVHFLGITIHSAITGGLGGMIGNYIAGLMADRYGVLKMYKLITIPSALGLAIFSICIIAWRNDED